jgi:hypothetical protein
MQDWVRSFLSRLKAAGNPRDRKTVTSLLAEDGVSFDEALEYRVIEITLGKVTLGAALNGTCTMTDARREDAEDVPAELLDALP